MMASNATKGKHWLALAGTGWPPMYGEEAPQAVQDSPKTIISPQCTGHLWIASTLGAEVRTLGAESRTLGAESRTLGTKPTTNLLIDMRFLELSTAKTL